MNYNYTPNMYNSSMYRPNRPNNLNRPNDDRLIGGFAFPFLLGGVTGAALAPAFWGPGYGYNRPVYYYPPYPYYGPYYR